ncbi:MAG: ABC transporter substrate-binding protein, partial [Albidovulum sp.]
MVLVSCGWAAGISGAAADTLRIAVPSDPGYLDPAYWGSTVDQFLIDNLYPRLAKYVPGDEWKVELDAASSVDLSDPQNIKFELKPGIMWTGGYGELTAEDVEYSFERHLDADLESGVAAEFELLQDVEVTGTYTG